MNMLGGMDTGIDEQPIVFEAPADDVNFAESLKQHAKQVDIVSLERFEGLAEVIQVIVTGLTSAGTAVLIAYLREQTKAAKNRVVIKDGRKIRLQGYSAEEAERLISNDDPGRQT
jgi:hypothetical protein